MTRPELPSDKPKTTESLVRFDWGYVRRIALEHRPALLRAHIVAILAASVSVPIPLLLPLLVDEVLLGRPGVIVQTLDRVFPAPWQGPIPYLLAALGVTLAMRLLALTLNVWQTRQFTLVAKDLIFRIRELLIRRLGRVAMAEFETLGSGKIVTHLVTDLETLDTFISSTISRMLVAVFSIAGTSAILLFMHWRLAMFILLLNPVVIYFTGILGKNVKRLKSRENAAIGAFQLALTETLDTIQQVRASNREGYFNEKLLGIARVVRRDTAAFAWRSDAANRMSFLIFQFGVDVFRCLAMITVLFSDLSIGQMMAVFGYLWFMMGPIQEILGIQYAYFGARAALERINQLLELKLEPQYPKTVNPFFGKSNVGVFVENLHFEYPNGTEVLHGINLNIQPGEKVAFVGASGGGKSTLVQILIGLYPPTSGMVYFDGAPLTEIGMPTVREHVATVLQHPAMLNDTVRANLEFGAQFPDDALWEALAMAQLKETVERFPNGLETLVGRFGLRLSGGQRQRLAIARMILTNPCVVIFDEATSALDSATEARLHSEIKGFLADRTTIIVAHRLSAIRAADRIFVFEDGEICEQGGHDALLAGGGLYTQFYGDRR